MKLQREAMNRAERREFLRLQRCKQPLTIGDFMEVFAWSTLGWSYAIVFSAYLWW